MEREPLQQIRTGTVWLVVGRARKPLRPTRANLLAYDRVVRRIDEASFAMLPARFGEVFENADRLNALVVDRHASMRKALDAVEHKTQMTLRLLLPEAPARQGNIGSDPRPPSLKLRRGRAVARRKRRTEAGDITGVLQSSGRTYLEARAAALRPPKLPEVEAVHRRLASLVRRERFRAGPAAGALTLYHLIEKGEDKAYLAAVQKCAAGMPGVTVQASGPFPPYAFTDDIW
jgi:hypothetical protein